MTNQLVMPPGLMEAAALYWAGTLGVPALPVEPMGKRPLGALAPHGVKDATTDPAVIRTRWATHPSANIGLACGIAFWVLDVDGEAGEASLAALQARHGPLPATVTTRTGSGGWHLYFALPEGRTIRNSVRRLGPGLDTRALGGYVVAPPSIHPNGRPYAFVPGREPWSMPLAMAPAWLLDRLDSPPAPQPIRIPPRPPVGHGTPTGDAYANAALEGEILRLAAAPEGQRNDTLNRSAFALGQLVGAGRLAEGMVRAMLASVAKALGLKRREIEATIASGLRAGAASPREARHG